MNTTTNTVQLGSTDAIEMIVVIPTIFLGISISIPAAMNPRLPIINGIKTNTNAPPMNAGMMLLGLIAKAL